VIGQWGGADPCYLTRDALLTSHTSLETTPIVSRALRACIAAELAANAAAAAVTDESMAMMVGEMVKETVLQLSAANPGFSSAAHVRYAQGPLCVVEVATVPSAVDVESLLAAGGDQMVAAWQGALRYADRLFGSHSACKSSMQTLCALFIQHQLRLSLPNLLDAALREGGLRCEITAKPAGEQADFFYERLRPLGLAPPELGMLGRAQHVR